MKDKEMTSQEHVVAVFEPTLDGETTIDLARQVVDRGGRATVVVLLTRDTLNEIAGFAEVEGMTFPDAREIYSARLAESYSTLFGGETTNTIFTESTHANRIVFEIAATDGATSVAMPQRLVAKRGWKTSVVRSQVPVLIAPKAAA